MLQALMASLLQWASRGFRGVDSDREDGSGAGDRGGGFRGVDSHSERPSERAYTPEQHPPGPWTGAVDGSRDLHSCR